MQHHEHPLPPSLATLPNRPTCPAQIGPAHPAPLPILRLPNSQVEGPSQIARRSDMDMNGHINNAVYLAWALESVPQDIYDNYTLFEVGFMVTFD